MSRKKNPVGWLPRAGGVLAAVVIAVGLGMSAASAQQGRALGKKSEITGKGRATAEEAKKGGLRLGREAKEAKEGKRGKADHGDKDDKKDKMKKERERAEKRMDKEKRKRRY